jgi:hypothetical protein
MQVLGKEAGVGSDTRLHELPRLLRPHEPLNPRQHAPQHSLVQRLPRGGLPRRLGPLQIADQPVEHTLHLLRPPPRLPRRHALLGRHAPRDFAQHNLDSVAHPLAGALLGGDRDARAVVPQRLATAVARDVRERHALARRPALGVAVEHDAARRALAGAVAREGVLAQTRQLSHRGHARAAAFGVRRQRLPARLAPRLALAAALALAGGARGARDDHHVLGVGEAAHRRVGAVLGAPVPRSNLAAPVAAAAVVVGGEGGLERRKRAALALRRDVRRRCHLGRRAVALPAARAAPERGGRAIRSRRGRRRRGSGRRRSSGRSGRRLSVIRQAEPRSQLLHRKLRCGGGHQRADDLELFAGASARARPVVVGTKGSVLVRSVALPTRRARPVEGRRQRRIVEHGSELRLEHRQHVCITATAARSGRLAHLLSLRFLSLRRCPCPPSPLQVPCYRPGLLPCWAGGRGGRRLLLLRRAGHVRVRADGALALRPVRRLAARVAHAAPLAGGADRDGERVLAQQLLQHHA